MSTSHNRITIRSVDNLQPGEIAWDTSVRGFGVRRQTDKRVYFLKARFAGRQRWFTIGEHGAPWAPESARKEAQRLWGAIRSGRDPAIERPSTERPSTMADLCKRFLDDHAGPHKKPSSVRMDRKNMENHVIPLLGRKEIAKVTRADIDVFKRAVREGNLPKRVGGAYRGGGVVKGGPGVANRCLSLLSKMFNLAERWGLRPDGTNPVRHVERYREEKKERFLSPIELRRLGQAIERAEKAGESVFVIAALRLLIFTGARLGEILTLRWEHVDLDHSVLKLVDSKSGRKRVYLSPPACEVLASLPRVENNPFVVVGHRRAAHLVNIQKPWQRIRKHAALIDVRIHDLRHSFASVAVASGLTLPLIGKLLGHTKSATTERYAHLADDPLRTANNQVGKELAIAMGS